MAPGASSSSDGDNDPLSLDGRTLTGRTLQRSNPSDELVLLWRALLVVSGNPATAEAALLATVEQSDFASDEIDRLVLWQTGFDALKTEQDRDDVVLLGEPVTGSRAAEVNAVADFLDGSTPLTRRLLLGHHLGQLNTEELVRFVSDQPGGAELDQERLAEWIDHDTRVASRAVPIKPQHWPELLALLWPPVHPDRLLRGESRSWRTGVVAGGAAVVVLLFVALFSLNRGTPPVAEDAGTGSDSEETAEEEPVDQTDTGPPCPAPDLATRVLVTPVYQGGLRASPLPEVLDASDLVVRGALTSIELERGGVRFELGDSELVFGSGPPPLSFFLNARFDATGDAIPNGELYPDALVFLNRVGDRWEVAKAGGLWVSCEESTAYAVGGDWPLGPQWPQVPTPAALATAIDETVKENAEFAMVETGERTAGGFRLFDGRRVVFELPSGMHPRGDMSVTIRAEADVLATVDGPVVRLVIREEPCNPIDQERAPLAVCSSDGRTVVEVASPLVLSDAWLDRIDVFLIDEGEIIGDPDLLDESAEPVVRATRTSELVAMDPVAFSVVWRAPRRTLELPTAVTSSEVAVLADGNLRMLDAVSGEELWAKKINPTTRATPLGQDWLVAGPGTESPALELVDGRTGAVLWSQIVRGVPRVLEVTEALVLTERWIDDRVRVLIGRAPADGELLWSTSPEVTSGQLESTLLVDPDRGIVATLDEEGSVRLVELADGRTRWTTSIPSAISFDGIWLSTLTVNSSSGQVITVNLADGFILPP